MAEIPMLRVCPQISSHCGKNLVTEQRCVDFNYRNTDSAHLSNVLTVVRRALHSKEENQKTHKKYWLSWLYSLVERYFLLWR